MGNCQRCVARQVARMPQALRDKRLAADETLRELAREEWREDVRQLREHQRAADEALDSVRGVDDAGAPGHQTN